MSYRIDLSKKPHEIIILRINYIWGKSYLPDDVVFNKRGAWPLDSQRARKLGVESKIIGNFTRGYTGGQEFFYTRADLTEFFDGVVVEIPNTVMWTYHCAPYLAEELGLQLEQEDIQIDKIPEGTTDYLIKIAEHHPSFKGTLAVRFIDPTPRFLKELVTKRDLDGFKLGVFQ